MFWENEGRLAPHDPRLDAPAAAVRTAAETVMDQIRSGEVSEEEPITQRLAAEIRNRFESIRDTGGVSWKVRAVTPKKHTEKQHGTDLAIWVQIDLRERLRLPGYRATKAVLVQAKREDKLSGQMSVLRDQIEKMHQLSDAAAVFIVGADRMLAADADALRGSASPSELLDRDVSRPLSEFFRAILRCQFGDQAWDSPAELREELETATFLMLDGTDTGASQRRSPIDDVR